MQKLIKYTPNPKLETVEFTFVTVAQRGWFSENVKPQIEMIKRIVPSTERIYDQVTYKWTVSAKYWDGLTSIFKLGGWTLQQEKQAPPSKLTEEYVKNFYYTPPTPAKPVENIAESLSKYLGVPITTQDLSELKKLYRAKARELHPDFGGSAAEMSELNRLWTLYSTGGVN